MKKFAWGIVVLGVGAFAAWKFSPTTKSDKRNPAEAPSYCIALRGNGEAEPAHWGALARSVEQLGLPSAMAGGSSAAISMFLMESIAAHPLIKGQPVEVQKERAALLLKSLVGFVNEVQKTNSWQEFKKLYGLIPSTQDQDTFKKALSLVNAKRFAQARDLLTRAVDLGLLDPNGLNPLLISLQKQDFKRSVFYIQEYLTTASVFGHFNARTDNNIFFRSGIVSFEKAAESFGKIAAFYAVASQNANQVQNWQGLFDACAKSNGQSWLELAQKKPACTAQFSKLFQNEFSGAGTQVKMEENRIGWQLPVYPTTAILTGTAVAEFREAQLDYHRKMDPQFGAKFEITNSDDIRFGYWGDPEELQRIEDGLNMNDQKSRRFVPLGSTTWRQVLSLSPAEPGLSPLKEFSTETGKEFVSAGGWSDLHPVLVLKAAGCQNVLYVTRRGGESIFAQGVAKRLFGFERDWSLLNSEDKNTQSINDEGDASDQSSLWSYLYNLANPDSSFNQALQGSAAVMCTNWNDFPVTSQMAELVDDAYRASYWVHPQTKGPLAGLSPKLTEKRAGCAY